MDAPLLVGQRLAAGISGETVVCLGGGVLVFGPAGRLCDGCAVDDGVAYVAIWARWPHNGRGVVVGGVKRVGGGADRGGTGGCFLWSLGNGG